MPEVNGVNTERIEATVSAIQEDPALANVTFSLSSEWKGAFKGASTTGPVRQAGKDDQERTIRFSLESDEPPLLLGEDSAASAGEYVLEALAACYAVTFAANAAVRGISLTNLRFDLEGDFDLHGFLDLDENVRPGMQELRVKVTASSPDASREQLEELVHIVEQRSPIRDTLATAIPVITELV